MILFSDAVLSNLAAYQLTRALREAGTLQHGEVVSVNITEQRRTAVSHLRWLEVDYSPDTSPVLPNRLLLKWPIEQSTGADRDAETTFNIAPTLSSPPIVHCLATAPASSTEQWLLLEDLRSTHWCPPWPEQPSEVQVRQAVAVLPPTTCKVVAPGRQPADVRRTTYRGQCARHGRRHYSPLAGLPRSPRRRPPTHDHRVLQDVFSSQLKPWLRLTEPRNLTLIHGDVHTWNFLFPRAGEDTPYLIDGRRGIGMSARVTWRS